MKVSKLLVILSTLVALLALAQAGVGVFWQDGGQPYTFTNLRGEAIPMSGQGIYRDNPAFNAPIQRGTDVVTLFCVLGLIAAILLYRRGSLRGQLLLTGLLAVFLYNSASVAFGVTYNSLFLLYVAFFSASLFAFVLTAASIEWREMARRLSSGAPRTGFVVLLAVSAVGLLFAWLPDNLAGLAQGWHVRLASYTTMVTDIFDLGIILPALAAACILLLRRQPLGYLLASILTTMLILIGIMITAQTVAQSLAGIQLGMGEFIGKGGSFMLLSLIGIWLMARLLRSIPEPGASRLSSEAHERA